MIKQFIPYLNKYKQQKHEKIKILRSYNVSIFTDVVPGRCYDIGFEERWRNEPFILLTFFRFYFYFSKWMKNKK